MRTRIWIVGAVLCLIACVVPRNAEPPANTAMPQRYMPSSLCKGCHTKIYDQHSQSHHEQSFLDPAVAAQYFQEVLPGTQKDPSMVATAEGCTACHAPQLFALSKKYILSKDEVDPAMPGITCDLCHTITGYAGGEPGNGNYLSKPSEIKFGPFREGTPWHHAYSSLLTKSEFCAICHNAKNRHGLEIKGTYREWKASRYAKEGVQCQDCHMNQEGFLINRQPTFEKGKAAEMKLGQAPDRRRLYTHRFPGAHSRSQIVDCVLVLRIAAAQTAAPGETVNIRIMLDNTRTGHKMPSGSPELRLLWLELSARMGDRIVPIPAPSLATDDHYDVSGAEALDAHLLRNDVPQGSRIYRTVLADGNGEATLSSYKAEKVLYDNRLDAGEVREEQYALEIPKDYTGQVVLLARLNYQAYPGSFAEQFGIPKAEPYEVSSATGVIEVK